MGFTSAAPPGYTPLISLDVSMSHFGNKGKGTLRQIFRLAPHPARCGTFNCFPLSSSRDVTFCQ